jgi:hypothetical protein
MGSDLALLDVVALASDQPEHGLRRGQTGTVVEQGADGVFIVEFSDGEGRTIALPYLRAEQLTTVWRAPSRGT